MNTTQDDVKPLDRLLCYGDAQDDEIRDVKHRRRGEAAEAGATVHEDDIGGELRADLVHERLEGTGRLRDVPESNSKVLDPLEVRLRKAASRQHSDGSADVEAALDDVRSESESRGPLRVGLRPRRCT
jgi:hypothetical protein